MPRIRRRRVRRLLSDRDCYFLRTNMALEPGPFKDDPQAQAFYTVAANETDLNSPVWTREQVVSWVRMKALAHGLQIRISFRSRIDQYARVRRGGGTIVLPVDYTRSTYQPMREGAYLASIIVHEFAHVLAGNVHWETAIRSHGPEFVRCFLDLLSGVMPTDRTEESLAYLDVRIAVGAKHRSSAGLGEEDD